MQIEDETVPGGPSRGRVVMLVDNDVVRDSRVQKAAQSMADSGWEVHLLGSARGKRRRSWRIGGARVRLLPVQHVLLRDRHGVLRATLRRPLAYGHPKVADYRRRLVQSRRADLAAARLDRNSRGPARKVWLLGRRVTAKFQSRWVALRVRQTESLAAARLDPRSPVERLTIGFWLKVLGDRAWRVLNRNLWDWDSAYGKVIDRLEPDIVHANDFRMLGVAARSVRRARAKGRKVKLVWDAHEFLPGIRPWGSDPRWHPAMCAYEREYAGDADAVVTVSEALADRLVERHGLRGRPTVVLNAPITGGEPSTSDPVPDMREMCGVGPDTPIAVYSGAAAPQRGLDIMIEALPRLPGLHVALVVSSAGSEYVRGLVARAAELGAADRVHTLPYVPFDQVVPFLATADVGVIPIHHWPNHEIALITKFFEYSHARLPIVVSDVEAMGDMAKATGQGEVFRAEDLDDYVRAVEAVLADPRRYRAVYDDRPELLHEWTWEAQAEILDGVYSKLLPSAARPAPGAPPADPDDQLIGAQD
ncbi:glycosyltransferase involved in cell wall biosynthesis [Actinomadura luteofluorescens]|uniref:Glycosyltransferase involved in cell wall biosynthesis n=1 Tax=Actinomadura luteofluorescens TaxID=46163 RepID=A0A7Y9EGW8_9ACTN|nr:glycosyltransferase family 4 protein [Actinomadura luteofluorescens]NYD47494.1 glycosyltransferase involved in cell wall biosynthesis [Actinomadura luteofluorescens]